MRIQGGQRIRFRALYFWESFFIENDISLPDSFWQDAKNSIGQTILHAPELESIYQRIERCRLTGAVFDTWLRGQGLSAAAYILDLVQQYSSHQPVYLDHSDLMAIENAKALIKASLKNTPTIPELCKSVGMNKNKLQRGFRLTEGKSIAEYIRILRMERALDLLEDSTLSILEVAKEVGYHGVSNFYHTFQQTFWETPPGCPGAFEKVKPASSQVFPSPHWLTLG